MSDQTATSVREPDRDQAASSASPASAEQAGPARASVPSRPTGESSPTRPAPPGSAESPAGPKVPDWISWVVFAILLAWNVLIFLPLGSQAVNLPYSDFVAQVRQGNVAEVEFSSQTISGRFQSAVTWPPTDTSSTNGQNAASPASASYSQFTTVMPPTNDPELLPLLQGKKVTVTAKDTTSSPGILADLLFSFLPTLLIIGLFWYSGRTMMRSGQNILGFGASKARKYDPERPSVTFADVAGEDEAKVELSEVVDFLKAPDRYRKLGARLPRGVLLVGPPGVGKTLIARAVAGEAHVAFFSISGSEFVEMFVGVGASRVRDLFAKAKETAPAIVFVDELDAVGRSRSSGAMGSNDEREQTLNQLLVEMDGFDATTNVIVIGATNRPDVLDQALLRPGRFDRQVTLGYPDRAGREAILRIHTRDLPLAPGVDLAAIARAAAGFSGADLANLANEAALLAARAGRTTVGMLEFEEAIDKIILGTKQAGLADPGERRTVAYHEGGHTLVALLTPGADPVQKVTIVPHGRALGVTEQRPDEDRRNYTRDYLLARLAVMLGGRAAEEVVFGQPTTGAESDLKAATDLARRMVGLWGMSDELGPVSYGVGETHQYLGTEVPGAREYAESTATRIDSAVARLIGDARTNAIELLRTHRATLDALAAELVDKEMVVGSRLAEILAETTGQAPAPDVTTIPVAVAGGAVAS
jgi:cell division protease FtsH